MDETGAREHLRAEQEFEHDVHQQAQSEIPKLQYASETQVASEKNGFNAVADGGVGEPIPILVNKTTKPELGVLCGPLLRYDTIEDGTWHGFVLVVTSRKSSQYDPVPTLTFRYNGKTYSSEGKNILQFTPPKFNEQDTFDFWRFKMEIELENEELKVEYAVNGGLDAHFFVPAKTQNMRWMAHSCNGFSSGVDTIPFHGPSPLWNDVLRKHEQKPFHVMIGGGDQLYSDPVVSKPEFQPWVDAKNAEVRESMPVTDDLREAIDKFYFWHYSYWFRTGGFGIATRSIPMLNMCDDHDVIDGFGSYPDKLLESPVFSHICQRGFYWYKVFQIFTTDEVDGDDASPFKSSILHLGVGRSTKQRNTSYISSLGPNSQIVMLDTRAERSLKYIVPPESTEKVFAEIEKRLGDETKHLVFMLGVPIAYPRMTGIEKVLSSKYNPLVWLGRHGLLGLKGFVNKFDNDAELLDDLNDHWCAGIHKNERNEFVLRCKELAEKHNVRISFVSGDVHCASASYFHDWHHLQKQLEHKYDPSYMVQIVSSAIVNTPPPPPVIRMINKLGQKKHHTLEKYHIGEYMIPLFEKNPMGGSQGSLRVMGHRNYCVGEIEENLELKFDICIEQKRGSEETTAYSVTSPMLTQK